MSSLSNIRKYKNYTPQINNCYIDPTAVIIGRVTISKNASLWCNVVARGDVSYITIGEDTNIQDLAMLHVTHYNPGITPESPLIIGSGVTVGHSSCLHACTIYDNVLVGMGSTVLDNAIVESDVIIGAGSLVPPNKILKSGYLYLGNPLRQARELTQGEIEHIRYSAKHYVELANSYKVQGND